MTNFFGIPVSDLIGYAGGILSSVSFIPQIIKIVKTRTAEDLSTVTLFFLFSNAALWLSYGILIEAKPLWVTNAIVVSTVFLMIILKIYFDKISKSRHKKKIN